MDFPILLSHLDDRYSIGQPSVRKQFLTALADAQTAWETQAINSALLHDIKAMFEHAFRLTWAELRHGKGAARDPASLAFWGRFATPPQFDKITQALRTARRQPDGLAVQEQVIDLLREVVSLHMLIRNLQKLVR
jgi:hypothetical protein